MSPLPTAPPADLSNMYATNADAVTLGQMFFYDARFSGVSAMTDSIGRPVPYARAAKGQPLNTACVTCHDLTGGAADPAAVPGNVSMGASWTDTNALTLWNSAFQTLFLWNGRADSLWAQAAGVLEATMGGNRLSAAWTIKQHYQAVYEALFTDYPLPMADADAALLPTLVASGPLAGQCPLDSTGVCQPPCRLDTSATPACWPEFPPNGKPGAQPGCQPASATQSTTEPFGDAFDCMDPADQSAVTRVAVNFGKALAAFENQLITGKSPFDDFVTDLLGGHATDSTAISDDAKNGALLFVGKAGCSDCHNTPLLSDGEFYNIGVPQIGTGVPTVTDCPQGGVCDCVTPKNCLPFGASDGNAKLTANPYRRSSMWSDDPTDSSRTAFLAEANFPKGGFRVPSLRNVALTAPYMHDGSLATLEDVVALYNQGGDPDAVGVPAARIKPLMLTDQEQSSLVAFLKTLTGEPPPSKVLAAPTVPP